jgi:hypothetical protein
MINPWRVHRARATIIREDWSYFYVQIAKSGGVIKAWRDDFKKFKVGDVVNIQATFSITSDSYYVKTMNKPRVKKPRLRLVAS